VSEIHYFPRYSQPENVVTNNTLLLLLRLREYSRYKFENFMEKLCGDQDVQLASSWLRFQQQKGTGKSIVDGFIAQDSVKIGVETKLNAGFDEAQLENHLAMFGGEQHKLLLLLSPSGDDISAQQLASVREQASPKNIQILHTSFEDIVKKANECLSPHDEEMLALVEDFEDFCSGSDLLPRDRCTLFVPPCGQSFEDNKAYRLYYCPAAWSRRNARYLGIYNKKSVQLIGRIAKVVTCEVDLEGRSVTVLPSSKSGVTPEEEKRIVEATEKGEERGWDVSYEHKFFLCDEMKETDFRKTSPGGIPGHRYFDLEEVLGGTLPTALDNLANKLREHTWE
jgi:hypothetical protein